MTTDTTVQEHSEKSHSRSISSGSTVQQQEAPIGTEKVTVGSFTQTSTSTEADEAAGVPTNNIAPPDGGYGWVVVGACFLNNFSMLGIMFSWGIFQQLYKDEVFPGQTSAVSWIGTLAFGCMYIVGGICSLFAAKIGYRKMIFMGSFLVAGGCIGASFATEVWHLYLTQGVLYGLGAAMANPCVLAAPSQWFVVRRGMASGIGISGSGVGGLVFSVLIEKLNASIGHRWCLRVIGIVVWCSMVTCALLIRQFSPNGTQAVNVSMKEVDTMRKPAFLILVSGVLLTSFGYFSPLNLLPSYAVDHGLTRAQGAMLNSFLNGASFFGRFAGGIFGDRFGLVNLTVFCVGASALTTLAIWMFATTLPVLLVYVILYGLMGGGFISLLAPVLAEQFGTSSLTILVGITFGVNGLGSLLGTPIATAILTSLQGDVVDGVAANSDKGYRGAIGFIGGVMLVGTLVFFLLKIKVGGKRKAVA
ncbi:MAG: major facilitator superfamily domain-containing protein [Linnemannia gamsii]|nr:MAG: major facilitator superfamily domain-containing protein [Linnemannia gamsii]